MSSAIVVGAGVLGSALADQLARRGWDVTLVEQEEPGHARAGSGGESRLIRCNHGPDEEHAAQARRAWALWHELDPALVVPCGIAWFARRPDGWEAAGEEVLHRLGIPAERVDARDLYPSVGTGDLSFCLLEREAGMVRAADATAALAARAVGHGAVLLRSRAEPEGAGVRLADGRVLRADRVVWACGAWLPGLFGDLGDALGLRITQQDLAFFTPPGPGWESSSVPAWVDFDGEAYGTGTLDHHGFKIGPDTEGPPLDPDAAHRVARPDTEAVARAFARRRFPALGDAPLSEIAVCQYELTIDGRFLCAPHPGHDGDVWLLGGGNGHAFKHGPALADRIAPQIIGDAGPDPAFALDGRVPYTGLRTGSSGVPLGEG
jgi:glycine/D-amino acid oxidase-like deaminating enzyme